MGDDFAAQFAGSRSEVEQLIGAADNIMVVLNDEQRVAEVAQLVQGADQACVVARVEADGRFVEDVEHTAQTAANLAGEADALRFATGECRRSAADGEILQPDFDQKGEAIGNFADQFAGNLFLLSRQFPFTNDRQQITQRRPAVLVDRAALELHRPRIVAQSATTTLTALNLAHQMFELGTQTGRDAGCFFESRVKALILKAKSRRRNTVSWLLFLLLLRFPLSPFRFPLYLNPFLSSAIHNHPPMSWRHLIERHVGRQAGVSGEGFEHGGKQGLFDAGPGEDGTFGDRHLGTSHQGCRVGADFRTEAFARMAPADRAVERKMMGRQGLEASAAIAADQMLAVDFGFPPFFWHVGQHGDNMQHATAEGECVFDAVGEPAAGVLAERNAVDNDFKILLTAAVDVGHRIEFVRLAIDADADVAVVAEHVPEVFIALAGRQFDRGTQIELSALGFGEDRVDHLVGALRADGRVAIGAVHLPQARKQDAKVIVDFGDRADRRAGRMAGGALFDGDRRRKALDRLDAWLLQLPDELSGVGTEAFDVAPLALGVDCIHRQRAFATTAGAAKDRKFVARDLNINAAKIMLLGTFDDNVGRLFDLFAL